VLEINKIPGRDLRALVELIGERRIERELNVHRTTIRRWLSGQIKIPGAQHIAIKALLGDLPGTANQWTGWRFHDGLLYSPAGDRYRSGEVLAIGLNRQIYNELAREVRDLKAKLQTAELALEHLTEAPLALPHHADR
jgi:predicted transcriptional regulator